jgi:hypothetical protein
VPTIVFGCFRHHGGEFAPTICVKIVIDGESTVHKAQGYVCWFIDPYKTGVEVVPRSGRSLDTILRRSDQDADLVYNQPRYWNDPK